MNTRIWLRGCDICSQIELRELHDDRRGAFVNTGRQSQNSTIPKSALTWIGASICAVTMLFMLLSAFARDNGQWEDSDPVISHCRDLPANSRSLLMVITQETTQPLATLHRLLTMRLRDPTEQQDVGLPLMIPLGMVMRNIFAQRPPQGALAKENDLRQALVLHRPDPSLSIGIQVRTAGRQCERFDPA